MLKCRDIPRESEKLLAGELSLWQRLMLHLHVFLCHNCRRYLRQLRTLLGALNTLQQRRDNNTPDVRTILRKLDERDESRNPNQQA